MYAHVRADRRYAVHQDLTLVRYLQAGDDLQEGGLTAAAGPDDRHELALVGGHVDAGQHRDQALVAAKRLLKLSQLQFDRPNGICHWEEPYPVGPNTPPGV